MSNIVRQVRERRSWGQAELARRAGISPNTLYRIESGRYRPRPGTLRRLAEALAIDPGELIEGPASNAKLAALQAAVAFAERTAPTDGSPSVADLIAEERGARSDDLWPAKSS